MFYQQSLDVTSPTEEYHQHIIHPTALALRRIFQSDPLKASTRTTVSSTPLQLITHLIRIICHPINKPSSLLVTTSDGSDGTSCGNYGEHGVLDSLFVGAGSVDSYV